MTLCSVRLETSQLSRLCQNMAAVDAHGDVFFIDIPISAPYPYGISMRRMRVVYRDNCINSSAWALGTQK